MKKKQNDLTAMQRKHALEGSEIIDEEKRIVRISCSSETRYLRKPWYEESWVEVLGHQDDEIDLTRAIEGQMPVFYNHDTFSRESHIGAVEKIWLEEQRLYADVCISSRQEVDGLWQDIKDGILTNVSVGYEILERSLTKENAEEPDEYRVTRWRLNEISFVGLPADFTVGVGRSEQSEHTEIITKNAKELVMKKDKTQDTTPAGNKDGVGADNNIVVSDIEKRSADNTRQEMVKRNAEITEMFQQFPGKYEELRSECLADVTLPITEVQKRLLQEQAKNVQPLSGDVRVITDEKEKFRDAAQNALEFRAGIAKDGVRDELGYTLSEMARGCLESVGESTRGLARQEMVGRAFTHSSSDFPLILSNVANKAMMKGHEEAEETFERFTSEGSLSDFRTSQRYGMGVIKSLREVKENAEYKSTSLSEYGENIKLAKYGEIFTISREAIINDDMDVFTKVPRKLGAAARRTVGDIVFDILIKNPTMSDGVALFDADHQNLLTGAGSAFGYAGVTTAKTKMKTQKLGGEGKALNIALKNIIVPVALEEAALQLQQSESSTSASNSKVNNIHRSTFEVISDARLDEDSATKWYGAASPTSHDVIEVAYLNGNKNPYIEQQNGFDIDGVSLKVRLEAAAAPLDAMALIRANGS